MIRMIAIINALTFLTSGCDFYHKNRCEWYMTHDGDNQNLVEDGYAAVCLSNLVIERKKCAYKAKVNYAKSLSGQTFRISDMDAAEKPYPREIRSVNTCDPSPAESKRLKSLK